MHRKFNDDIFARCLVIMKNVVISYIKEYRGPTLSSSWKYFFGIIWDDLFISEVKLKLCLIFQNFKMATILSSRQTFFTGSYTGRRIYQTDSHEHFRHFELLIDALAQILMEIYHFQNLTYFWPGDVIDDVMSAWNITCTTRHPQQCTCKILFVWHQSFIVKSSGQTSWLRHKQTNTQGENIITSLTRVIIKVEILCIFHFF